ncbi:hypothetical protein VQ02_22095 [Methylobacterium variabile]|jgi:hypothetical protein|uniref:Uncharacterized protein n=2 Tax=Methylobacterium TaxID=407 RepID=A0A0J6SCX5_9HYPH|nr:hypothetical protein VQ02_22095 [Methylobacterium variabile]KMO37487.1 hypothetical protein VP06_08145 [Methylobacterium aquaticum]
MGGLSCLWPDRRIFLHTAKQLCRVAGLEGEFVSMRPETGIVRADALCRLDCILGALEKLGGAIVG